MSVTDPDSRPESPPLERHLLVRTDDVGRAEQASNRLISPLSPHVLKPDAVRKFGWTMHAAQIGQSTLIYHSTRSAVEIIASEPTDHVALHVVLRGRVDVSTDLGTVRLTKPGSVCVVSPTERLWLRFAPGTRQLAVRIPNLAIERGLGRLTGESDDGIVFGLSAPAPAPWLSTLRLAVTAVDDLSVGTSPPPRIGEELERMLISSLLLTHSHSATHRMTRPVTSRAERAVTAIAHRIRSAPETAVDFTALAKSQGISLRTLQNGFRLRHGQSPSAFLRDARLDVAHALLTGEPPSSVTDAALDSGFTHLGRFARDYRLRYGVSPSVTRDAARNRTTGHR
ncbi:AraC family transcriptional regulator [Streptomyces sp. NPDC004629]|uniref:AraC family transcriptional regulator n=1 Tax=Streptomyces sp. NPDC004629 TaxID=3364705 RepID=UPI0036A95992